MTIQSTWTLVGIVETTWMHMEADLVCMWKLTLYVIQNPDFLNTDIIGP